MPDLTALLTEFVPDPVRRKAFAEAMEGAGSAVERWRHLSRGLLTPDDPHPLHVGLFEAVFADRASKDGPAPAWSPTPNEVAETRLSALGSDYAEIHRRSNDDPEWFWQAALSAIGINPTVAADRVLTGPADDPVWFGHMRLNAAEACFSGRDPKRVALIRGHEERDGIDRITLGEIEARAIEVAQALEARGLQPGDAWAIDMPMTADSIWIYLGIVLAGGVVVSIADSFSPPEIATRLEIAGAKGIFTQDVIVRGARRLPLYTRVCAADAPTAIVLPAGDTLAVELRDGDVAWADFLAAAEGVEAPFSPHVADASDASNILFSSGTTGTPKAIPWTHLTPIKAAADGWAHHDIHPGHVVAWPTNLGWMMGPWLIYASLLNDAAIALYEGSPGGPGFCRFVEDAGVTMLGVVPSLVKAWRTQDATRGLDWSRIRCFSSTGEASNADDMLWLMARAGYAPVIEYCGGTEIGGGYITGSLMQPQAPSTFSTPAIGCRFVLLDERGQPSDEGEVGLVAPLFGSSQRLLNRDHAAVYFEGMPKGPDGQTLRRHGDRIAHLGGGYYRAQGRADDAMNLGGIKISSAEIERVCTRVAGVHEVAAIAHDPPEGGPSQLVLVVVPEGDGPSLAALQQAIRAELNPLFKVRDVWPIDALPRTASNKVMRRVLRARYAARDA